MPERYFRNKVESKTTPHESPQKAAEQPWDSDTCTTVAQQLVKKCLDHYESDQTSSSGRGNSLGTLYCGALSARVYLRLRLAQHLKSLQTPPTTSTFPITKPSAEIESLVGTATQIAEEAVEVEEKRSSRHKVRVTLLEGPFVGAKCLLAVLYGESGQQGRAKKEAEELLEFLQQHTAATSLDANECEVLYGRAGALQAIFFLRRELGDDTIGSELVLRLAQTIVTEGLRTAAAHKNHSSQDQQSLPLLWEWHGKPYLGAAHGVVGILHTLMCLTKTEMEQIMTTSKGEQQQSNLPLLVQEAIHALDSYCWPDSGNLRSSIGSSSNEDKLVHWCHGAPGHVLLLVKAYEVFQDDKFLQKARAIGNNVIWPRGLLKKGVGLCHGISGNAYGLLALGRPNRSRQQQEDNDEAMVWMRQACYFAAFSLENLSSLESVPDRPFSLFEGVGGLAVLMMDLATLTHHNKNQSKANLHDARFPLYDF